jgi:acyl phosphate:glycerol-3-phosphate acyltransferase
LAAVQASPGTATLVLLLIGAYFLGAVPFGVLIARARGVDITKIGSGNIGATNVHRALGWKAGLVVMALDASKSLIPALIAKALGFSVEISLLAGFVAVLGHCASPFLGFKGGKGIATILGSAIGATPLVAAGGLSVFMALFLLTGYVSVGSIAAVLSAILFAYLLRYDPPVIAAYTLVALFIIYKHRLNIRRLLRGEEPKTSLRGGEKRQEAQQMGQDEAL